MVDGGTCGTAAMHAGKVAAEDEDLVRSKGTDTLRSHPLAGLGNLCFCKFYSIHECCLVYYLLVSSEVLIERSERSLVFHLFADAAFAFKHCKDDGTELVPDQKIK